MSRDAMNSSCGTHSSTVRLDADSRRYGAQTAAAQRHGPFQGTSPGRVGLRRRCRPCSFERAGVQCLVAHDGPHQGAVAALLPSGRRPRVEQAPSSTLLSWSEGGSEPGGGDGLVAEGAGAEDEGEHELQFVQDLVEGHPGAGAFGSVRIMVQKAWASTARVM